MLPTDEKNAIFFTLFTRYGATGRDSRPIDPSRLFAWAVVARSLASPNLSAQQRKPDFRVPDDIQFRAAGIRGKSM